MKGPARVYRLIFDDSKEGRQRFAMLYVGFISGGNMPQSKGMEVVRREAKILDQFDDVGRCESADPDSVVWSETTNQITLDQPQFELLKRYFESASWSTMSSRLVVSISDWLASRQPEESGDGG
jgi:hypothetical protein